MSFDPKAKPLRQGARAKSAERELFDPAAFLASLRTELQIRTKQSRKQPIENLARPRPDL